MDKSDEKPIFRPKAAMARTATVWEGLTPAEIKERLPSFEVTGPDDAEKPEPA